MKVKFLFGVFCLILTGAAMAQPVLTLSTNSIDFGDAENGAQSTNLVFVLENTGDAPLTINLNDSQFPNGTTNFFIWPAEGVCFSMPLVLQAGDRCTFDVSYTPSGIGVSSFDVIFVSDSASSPDVVSLAGNATPGKPFSMPTELSISAESGKTEYNSVNIYNYSSTATTITGVTAPTGDLSLDEDSTSCGVSSLPWVLPAQSNCILSYVFNSTANVYTQQDIVFTSDAPSSPDVLSIRTNEPPMMVGPDIESGNLNFGNVVVGETRTTEVRLINSSSSVLEITLFPVPNGAEFTQIFPGSVGDCGVPPFTLNNSEECTLHYSFAPTSKGKIYSSITIEHDGGNPAILSFEGAGAGAAYELSVSPSLLDFGDVQVGQFSPGLSFSVTNTGVNELTLSDASIFPDFNIDPSLQVNPSEVTCQFPWPIQLLPGETCNFYAVYSPTAIAPMAFNVEIVSDAPSSPDIVALTGQGIEGEPLSLSDTLLTFGNPDPGTIWSGGLTLSNNSLTPTTISDITAPIGGFTYSQSQTLCDVAALPFVLPAMSSCFLTYDFVSATYDMEQQIIIVTSDAPSSPHNFTLAGNITPTIVDSDPNGSNISNNGSRITFGFVAVGETKEIQTIRLLNTDSQTIQIISMDMPSGVFQQLFPGAPGDCPQAPFSLAGGAECALYYSFTPATDQAYSEYLYIAHDGIKGYKYINISGSAIPRGITYTPSVLDFGYVAAGQTSETLAVRFTGSAGITITELNSPSGDFSIVSHDCPTSFPVPVPISLPFDVDCTLNVAFTPSVEAVVSQDVVAISDGPTSPDGYTLTGTSIPPSITYTPSVVDFGNVAIGQTSETKAVRFMGSTGLIFNALDDPSGDFSVISHDCPSSFPLPIPTTLFFDVDCTLNIAFTPSIAGAISQDVVAVTNASTSPDSFSLLGTGVATAPAAPAITALEAGDGEILVRFSTNGDGGSPITGYVATCGDTSAEAAGSPITVTGLQNDISYSCSVVAVNSVGSSAPSVNVPETPGVAIQRLNIILIKAAIDAQ